jgi:uncharacterized protein (DUF934 family)
LKYLLEKLACKGWTAHKALTDIASTLAATSHKKTMKIISAPEHQIVESPAVLAVANDIDPRTLDLQGVHRIDLTFPKFTDGRAYSQAFLLRRRLGFQGELRATGDVLIDQLVQMQRTGFDVAVLREGVDASAAQRQFDRFAGFYQGSAVDTQPQFSKSD